MATYTTEEKATIIEGWRKGLTWRQVGELVPDENGRPRSPETIQRLARRMRGAGEWPADKGPRENPRGRGGRPRNRIRSRKVSPRFATETDAALRAVAEAAGMRTGEALTVACERMLQRLRDTPRHPHPLGLSPGDVVKIQDGARAITLSCAIDLKTFDALRGYFDEHVRDNTIVHDAAIELLEDLNYEVLVP